GSPVAASGWGDPLPNPRHSSIALMAFSAQIGPPDRFVGCAAASKLHKGEGAGGGGGAAEHHLHLPPCGGGWEGGSHGRFRRALPRDLHAHVHSISTASMRTSPGRLMVQRPSAISAGSEVPSTRQRAVARVAPLGAATEMVCGPIG